MVNKNLLNKFNFDKFKTRKFKYGSIATGITILFIAVIVGINVLAKVCDDKFDWSFDLTKNKIFKLTDDSKEYLSSLDKDVEIIVLNTEDEFISSGEYFVQANNVIKQYSQNSDKISLTYISLSENPNLPSLYPNEELDENSIIVKCEGNTTTLNASDLFNIQSYYYNTQITSSKAEEAMTSAIINVTTTEKSKIVFIKGFEEEDSSALESLLEKNNYEIVQQTILTEDIDATSNVLVMYGPQRDLDNAAIQKLNNYIGNNGQYGKNIFYIVSPNKKSTPNLDAFLKNWDIKIDDGIVFDSDYKNLLVPNNPFYAIHEYVDTDYTKDIKNTSIPVAFAFCKPLEILNQETVSTLLTSSDSSGIRPATAGNNWVPGESDLVGSIPSLVAGNKYNDSEHLSRVVVAASVIGFDSESLSRTSLNNSQYTLNLFRIFTEREDNGINIESKSLAGEELGINANQIIYFGIIFIAVLPLTILIIGIIICVRRRRK